MESKTSDGLRPLVSNSSLIPLPLSQVLVAMSLSMETTPGLWKAGGNTDTATKPSTEFFEGSTTSYTVYPAISTLSRPMSQVSSTQQMTHLEEYLDLPTFFSLPSVLQMNLTHSSLTQPSCSLPLSYNYCGTGNTPFLQQNSLIMPSSNSKLQSKQSLSVQK